jgi:hypothetical protein
LGVAVASARGAAAAPPVRRSSAGAPGESHRERGGEGRGASMASHGLETLLGRGPEPRAGGPAVPRPLALRRARSDVNRGRTPAVVYGGLSRARLAGRALERPPTRRRHRVCLIMQTLPSRATGLGRPLRARSEPGLRRPRVRAGPRPPAPEGAEWVPMGREAGARPETAGRAEAGAAPLQPGRGIESSPAPGWMPARAGGPDARPARLASAGDPRRVRPARRGPPGSGRPRRARPRPRPICLRSGRERTSPVAIRPVDCELPPRRCDGSSKSCPRGP